MARSVTKVGNLTRDPELRFSQAGTAWCKFGLAVTPYTPKTKKRDTDNPQFYDVRCFRGLAEHVAESLGKGDRVIVQGDPENTEWTDQEGKKRVTKVILANAVGAELRFATVQVDKARREGPQTRAADDADEVDEDDF